MHPKAFHSLRGRPLEWGRERGKLGARETRGAREREKEAPAGNPWFISSLPLINMQTANICDRLPVKCQPIEILLTFAGTQSA